MAVQETGKKFTVQEIESTLTEGVAAILAADKASLGGDQPFHELGIDSLGLVEILVFIEKTFKLQLIHSDLTRQDFETIRSLASFIHKNL
ncbi:MAG TPA: acyl carrier protein [Nitrospirota bacterium]|nr:acyl carrier protein [Nitrospirota bacterium]